MTYQQVTISISFLFFNSPLVDNPCNPFQNGNSPFLVRPVVKRKKKWLDRPSIPPYVIMKSGQGLFFFFFFLLISMQLQVTFNNRLNKCGSTFNPGHKKKKSRENILPSTIYSHNKRHISKDQPYTILNFPEDQVVCMADGKII